MIYQLLEDTPSFWGKYGLLIILGAFIVLMFVYNFIRSRKYQQQEQQLIENVKVGTKVKTYSGIYGTVVGIKLTTDGKVAVLALDERSTMEIDFRAIYALDEKKPVEENAEENAEEVKPEQQAEEAKKPRKKVEKTENE